MDANTCIVIDIWEGQSQLDFEVLKASGVAGVGIRLNDMNGGHHLDTEFTKSWAAASQLVRFPYFVYNPWVNGAGNLVWLIEHIPTECKAVAIDIEVRFPGYQSSKYAGEVELFLQGCKAKGIKTIIYTGAGYIDLLSKWPKTDYWWAQYPSQSTYFGKCTTWDDFKRRIANLDRPFNANQIPGTLKMWQMSGDYLLLPGSNRDMDVNVFYGSEQELADYFGKPAPVLSQSVETQVPAVSPTSSGLYTFSSANYWVRPGGGPLTLPVSFNRKLGDNMCRYHWPTLSTVIRRLNKSNPAAEGLISAPDWGPSKGLDGDAIRWIGLLWPGRNIVKIEEIVDGWGRIEGCSLITAGSLDVNSNPTLVHKVYDYNKANGYGERAKPVYVPILGGPWWVQMSNLISVDQQLPKTVRITANPYINVREKPSATSAILGRRNTGVSVVVTRVLVAEGGIWGKTSDGYIALRFKDANLTSWKI